MRRVQQRVSQDDHQAGPEPGPGHCDARCSKLPGQRRPPAPTRRSERSQAPKLSPEIAAAPRPPESGIRQRQASPMRPRLAPLSRPAGRDPPDCLPEGPAENRPPVQETQTPRKQPRPWTDGPPGAVVACPRRCAAAARPRSGPARMRRPGGDEPAVATPQAVPGQARAQRTGVRIACDGANRKEVP